MQTKEYLNQISRLNRMINNKLVEIQQLREMACNVTAIQNDERVKSTPDPDRLGATFSRIDEMERELDSMIDGYVDKKNTIISQIDSMEDENVYNILFARYIEKKTFEVIATEMNYSFRNITRLHGRALKEFEKKYGVLYDNMS